MKKLVSWIFFLIFLFVVSLLVPNNVSAITPQSFIVPDSQQIAFPGQDQSYSVTFRGNGEAVVTARVVFVNDSGTPLSSLRLRTPRVDPKDILAFQVFREKICSRYQSAEPKQVYTPPICLEYQDPDYFQSWYGNDKYQKTKTSLEADTINIALPQSIRPNASGSIILSFRAFGYAKKNLFGTYNFTFETLKTEDRIKALRVGVTTDSDIYLRGGKGKVDYRFEEGMATLKSAEVSAPTANSQLDYYAQQIGQGEINKTASNLLPLDSYLVKGSFADSRLKLYAKEILIFSGIILVLLYLIIRATRKFFSSMKSGHLRNTSVGSPSIDLFLVIGSSFIASFLIIAYTLALVFGRTLLFSVLPYEFSNLFYILLVLISIGIYGLLLFTPALILGLRKGVLWGLAAFGMTIFWLLVGGIVTFIILFLMNGRIYPPYSITPMMSRTSPANPE